MPTVERTFRYGQEESSNDNNCRTEAKAGQADARICQIDILNQILRIDSLSRRVNFLTQPQTPERKASDALVNEVETLIKNLSSFLLAPRQKKLQQ
jgi:hypothetical protein